LKPDSSSLTHISPKLCGEQPSDSWYVTIGPFPGLSFCPECFHLCSFSVYRPFLSVLRAFFFFLIHPPQSCGLFSFLATAFVGGSTEVVYHCRTSFSPAYENLPLPSPVPSHPPQKYAALPKLPHRGLLILLIFSSLIFSADFSFVFLKSPLPISFLCLVGPFFCFNDCFSLFKS